MCFFKRRQNQSLCNTFAALLRDDVHCPNVPFMLELLPIRPIQMQHPNRNIPLERAQHETATRLNLAKQILALFGCYTFRPFVCRAKRFGMVM